MFKRAKQAKQAVAQGAVAQAVIARELEWSKAIRANDVNGINTIQAILAADYTNIDAEANRWTRDDDLAHAPSVAELSDPVFDDVHLYPDAVNGSFAVVTGRDSIKGTNYRWTDTWALIGGQWQCVASQTSRIP